MVSSRSEDGSSALLGEPLLGLFLGDSLELSESVVRVLSLADSLSSSGEDDVEVHAENTSALIVLDTQIDVLLNTESKVAILREVFLFKLVLLDLQGVVEEGLSLLSSHSGVHCDLLVPLNGETSDSVSGF